VSALLGNMGGGGGIRGFQEEFFHLKLPRGLGLLYCFGRAYPMSRWCTCSL
jgi:hypothetical protein